LIADGSSGARLSPERHATCDNGAMGNGHFSTDPCAFLQYLERLSVPQITALA